MYYKGKEIITGDNLGNKTRKQFIVENCNEITSSWNNILRIFSHKLQVWQYLIFTLQLKNQWK
jgi:hypothetical protein